MSDISTMTPFQALDHVKSLRKGYKNCIGSLYKNVAVNMVQDFLEKCVEKWGREFMDCVERENMEEMFDERYMKDLGNKGKREFVFPNESPEWVERLICGRYQRG